MTRFASDYNYVRQENKCIPAGPERISADVCKSPDDTYMGSSGYRKIPGNTCIGGVKKDEKIPKKCSEGTTFNFLALRQAKLIIA